MSVHVYDSWIDQFGFVYTWFKSGIMLVSDSEGVMCAPIDLNYVRPIGVEHISIQQLT